MRLLFPYGTLQQENARRFGVRAPGADQVVLGFRPSRRCDFRRGEPVQRPAVCIAASIWHRIRIGPQDFVSVSFHTAAAQELIEETPVGDDLSNTRQRRYHG